MTLDDEQRKQIRDCLRKAATAVSDGLCQKFIAQIESSIDIYQTSEPEPTTASIRKELEKVYSLAEQSDPPIGLIRTLISRLSQRATTHIEIRAEWAFPTAFPDYPYSGDFKEWTKRLPAEVLVDAVRMIVSTGGKLVPGRSRGKGKRSNARYVPRILGRVKGAPDDAKQPGRPEKTAELELVMHLANDWATTTNMLPDLRRSGASGFGDFVHSVFQWCGLSDGEATYSMRRYRALVEAAGNPSDHDP